MMVSDKEYKEHDVFKQLLDYSTLYEQLGDSIFCFPTMGTKAIANIDSYFYSSMQGTLESIRIIVDMGNINDAYALLRKFYDSAIINIYTNLYLQDHFNLENFIVEKICNWLEGKEKLPRYNVMSSFIEKSDKLVPINILINTDNRYELIRSRCNDQLHYNSYSKVMLNNKEVYLKNRLKWLDVLAKDTKNIFILHLAYIFFMKDHYLMSSDHIDYLDCGMQPPEDSQYWVAPFIQDIFDKVINSERPDIASVIKENSAMHLQ